MLNLAGPTHQSTCPLPRVEACGGGSQPWRDEYHRRLRRTARCARAVQHGPRTKGAEIFLATPRIQKPGEEAHFQKIADAEPDGLLVRNFGGVTFCSSGIKFLSWPT